MSQPPDETERLPLSKAAEYLLDECRMVLPGIQALFGFQLVAVFNQRFEDLGEPEQMLHLGAIGLVVIAVALVMTPAALHRSSPRQLTAGFITLSTRLLLASMAPLALAISIDFFVVGRLVVGRVIALPAAVLFLLLVLLWFVLPRVRSLQRLIASGSAHP